MGAEFLEGDGVGFVAARAEGAGIRVLVVSGVLMGVVGCDARCAFYPENGVHVELLGRFALGRMPVLPSQFGNRQLGPVSALEAADVVRVSRQNVAAASLASS